LTNKGGGKELTSELFQIDVRQLCRQGRQSTDQFLIVYEVVKLGDVTAMRVKFQPD
jgi:hypothetical protein